MEPTSAASSGPGVHEHHREPAVETELEPAVVRGRRVHALADVGPAAAKAAYW
ncbi:hypothetical protein [Salinispora fenicalii]|uniref:hypothetical protein n=1 Tax=Salinispora fenicalii TaxID=1137263 RepID=UPI0012BBE401|nr:hypothetical protein [Salinispora fenicalii]